jgi:hypothetical protein
MGIWNLKVTDGLEDSQAIVHGCANIQNKHVGLEPAQVGDH